MKKIIMIQDWINAAVFGAVGNSTTLNIVVNGVTRATLTASQSSINRGYYRFSDWGLNASGLSSISINITGIGIGSGAEVNFNGGVTALADDFVTSYTLTTAELNAVKAAYISDTVAKSFAGTTQVKKIFAGTLQVYAMQYLLTISTITGVASQTINRTASAVDASISALSNGAILYLGDTLTIAASPATGYNNPTVTTPVTVNGNIVTTSYITAGSVNSYTLTISTITGVATQTINRTSSPLQGAATGALSNGATIYYGDVLTISATATSGYSAPTVTTPVTVTSNITTSSYVTAGTVMGGTIDIVGTNEGDGAYPGSYTPAYAITITSSTFAGLRDRFSPVLLNYTYSVGYSIKKSGVVKMSGTSSGFTLTATQMGYLNGLGAIEVNCTSPAGTYNYTYKAKLTITF